MSKKTLYKPYPYQEECLQRIAEAREVGEKRALVVMASGLGKTLTAAFAVERFFAGQSFGRVLILCHSEPILDQSKKQFKEYFGEEKSYGMFTNSHKTTDETRFLFATFQTMKTHRKEFRKDEFDYVIVDEAHHSHAPTYFPTIKYFEPKFLLGLTATPDRLDGQDIAEIYGEPVYNLEFVEANNRHLMTKCEYRMMLDDLLKEEFDEYMKSEEKLSIGQLNRTLFAPKRDEEIVRIIRQEMAKLDNPRVMIFCRGIPHARKIAKMLGDGTALVYNGQGDTANSLALSAFRDGKLQVIVSVQMLNEGVDVPDANMVVFLRNTVSPTIFYQQLGRGTRLAKGKEKTVVLDFVANCERIKTILELQKEIEGFRTQKPRDTPVTTKGGDEKPSFTLDIATPEFETRMVDIVELIERASKGREWTKEEIIEWIREVARKRHTNKLSSKDLLQISMCPGGAVFRRLFGENGMEKAVREAGLEYYWNQGHWTDQEVIDYVCGMAVDGIMPTQNAVAADPDAPSVTTIRSHFGLWKRFAGICGLKVPVRRSDIEILEDYLYASLEVDHWLSLDEMKDNPDLLGYGTYMKRFHLHSINDLRRLIIEKYPELSEPLTQAKLPRERFGKQAIKNELRSMTIENRRAPTLADIANNKLLPSYQAIFIKMQVTNLPGLYEACDINELLKTIECVEDKPKISEQYIIDGVIRLVREIKRKPMQSDIDACNYLPGYSCVHKRVGGIAKLDEICHFDEILAELAEEQKQQESN